MIYAMLKLRQWKQSVKLPALPHPGDKLDTWFVEDGELHKCVVSQVCFYAYDKPDVTGNVDLPFLLLIELEDRNT